MPYSTPIPGGMDVGKAVRVRGAGQDNAGYVSSVVTLFTNFNDYIFAMVNDDNQEFLLCFYAVVFSPCALKFWYSLSN